MKKFFLPAAVVLVAIALAGSFFLFNPPAEQEIPKTALVPLGQLEPEQGQKIDRSSYGIPLEVFSELPAMPKDFLFVKNLYTQKRIPLEYLSPAYFLQPEFYPNFSSDGLPYWLSPDPDRWNVAGYGVFPSDSFVSAKPGQTIRLSTTLRSGFGVRTFQGFHLQESISLEHKELFTIRFKEQTFLLGPSYPRFSKDWAKKIELEIVVSEKTPKGNYALGFDAANPQPELSQKWAQEHKGFYYNAAMFSPRKPLFKISLEVQ